MGKVIVMRKPEPVATPEVAADVVETPVITEAPKAVEAPVVETPVVELTVEAPVVETKVEAPVADAPVTQSTATSDANVSEEVVEVVAETPKAQEQAPVEAKPAETEVTAKARFKGHASAPMAKAEGKQELGEIIINAAPVKTERYQPKGAGSQVATNAASAAMTKPNY